MWIKEQRRIYLREGDGYPSTPPDAEWARLEPVIPPARPHGFPPRSTVYNILRKRHRNLQMNALCRHAEPASCELGCALLCDCDVTLGLASDKVNLRDRK